MPETVAPVRTFLFWPWLAGAFVWTWLGAYAGFALDSLGRVPPGAGFWLLALYCVVFTVCALLHRRRWSRPSARAIVYALVGQIAVMAIGLWAIHLFVFFISPPVFT